MIQPRSFPNRQFLELRQEPVSQPTSISQYRELLAIIGELHPGDSIVGNYRLTNDGKIDLRSRSGNVLLQVKLDAEAESGSISQFVAGKWSRIAQATIRHSGQVIIKVTSASSLSLLFDSEHLGEVLLNVEDVARIHGNGNWEAFERNLVADTLPVEELLIRSPEALEQRVGSEIATRDDLIFDIGFYDGSDTAYYLWRGYNVVAVEANPVLAARGAEYFSEFVASGRLHILNAAICDRSGTLPFFVNRVRPEWSSTQEKAASRGLGVEKVEVMAVPPSVLFEAFGIPHYLKIDIEGEDLCVIDALLKVDRKPQYVSFEVGPRVALAALEQLNLAGYLRFNIVDQSKIHMTLDHRVLPTESSLSGPEMFRFRRGSSGTFGERLGGPWLDLPSTKRWAETFLSRVAARNQAASERDSIAFGDWFDIHAAR